MAAAFTDFHKDDAPGAWGRNLSLYSLLGLDITASMDQIRCAYRRLARMWHPDRNQGDEVAKRKFQEIAAAYQVLSNDETRQKYDLGLLELLDVEDYLTRFQGLILTVCGLGMPMGETSMQPPRAWHLITAA